ncbi:hypothetical protein LFT48_08860 [Arthrobacter sp. FW305-123]|nr:hypothetical protein LFT48_08860 [Arthrobacter sp. FW305-123]
MADVNPIKTFARLGILLVGGVVFVAGQAAGLRLGQGHWVVFFNEALKPPICMAASVCAVAGFLLSYQSTRHQGARQEAGSR